MLEKNKGNSSEIAIRYPIWKKYAMGNIVDTSDGYRNFNFCIPKGRASKGLQFSVQYPTT